MNHDVFISYSSKNPTAAQAICHELEDNGIKCWMAPRDITPGKKYGDLIDDAILTCQVFLLVYSADSLSSQWCNGELNVAFTEGKTIIPYRIDATPLKGAMRVILNQTHWIDAYPNYKTRFKDLVAVVGQSLGKNIPSTFDDVHPPVPIPQPTLNRFKKYWWVVFVVLVSVIICFWVLENITYAKMKNIPDNDFVVYNAGRKMGYMQKSTNSIIVQAKYDYAIDFSEGLARVELYGKSGFIDKAGNEVIHLKYVNACNFSEGLAAVKLNDKWGYIDKTGNEVIPLKYDYAGSFSEGLAAVGLNGKNGFIDKTDKVVIPLKYDYAGSFSEGLAAVGLNSMNGFIDKTDNVVIPLRYDDAESFSEGLARVKLNGKYGYINKIGVAVIPLKYDFAGFFSEGLAYVELNGKEGYIDKTGKEVIPLKYDNVGYFFNEGLARVKLNGKWGFVDKSDRVVIPLKYDFVDNFSENKAKVTLNGEQFYIDKNGNRIE